MLKKIVGGVFALVLMPLAIWATPLTINLPQETLQQALDGITPFTIPAQSSSVQGTIVLQEIQNLKFLKGYLQGEVVLRGKNIKLATHLGNQKIYFDVGEIETKFICEASLRLEPTSQQLYITPTFKSLANSSNSGNAIAGTLLTLLNGKEIPVKLATAKKIMAHIGSEDINIILNMQDVTIEPDVLIISIEPKLSRELQQ